MNTGSQKKTYVDGFLKNSNPSDKGGFTICNNKDCKSYPIKQKDLTNNQVEIMACIIGMMGKRKTIISDSQLAVNCLNGKWKSRDYRLQPLVHLGRIILEIRKKELIWERRDTNLAGIYNEEYHKKIIKQLF